MKVKQAILFLHGALGSQTDLIPLMEIMQEKGFETYSFDFSGHGKNAAMPTEFRIDFFAHELENFLRQKHLKDITIFGYSMGGYVALYHKANFEDSPIARIFTYGTKFNWTEDAVARELPMLDPENLMNKYPAYVEKLQQKHGERWRHLLYSTAHMMQNLEKLDGLTKEDLIDFDIPVTLILGDQDRMVTTEETHLTRSWISHAQVKIISHSRHELERTNLKEISSVLVEEMLLN